MNKTGAVPVEYFETFDRGGRKLGLVARNEVHANGLWHKSAQVFAFNAAGALLLQQRARGKDLYAGLWDYSVGEHLQPGETFVDAARRGLKEELGISGTELEPLGGLRRVEQHGPGYDDREIQQAFRCEWNGLVTPEPEEVADVQFMALDNLRGWVRRAPEDFTPWLLSDLKEFGYL